MSEQTSAEEFSEQAKQSSPGIFGEFLEFVRCNKKWWLTPIILVLLLVGALILLSSTAVAPFMYTLF